MRRNKNKKHFYIAKALGPNWSKGIKKSIISDWLFKLLPTLKRNTTRTEKCRLILSVERGEYPGADYAAIYWTFFNFETREVGSLWKINDGEEEKLASFSTTTFQKYLLDRNPRFINTKIFREELRPELGSWDTSCRDSSGGEAIIGNENDQFDAFYRVQHFDPCLFTSELQADDLEFVIHQPNEYRKATGTVRFFDHLAINPSDLDNEDDCIPIHPNVIKNFANIEIFLKSDSDKSDCLGWITIMERGQNRNLRSRLRSESLTIEQRREIAIQVRAGLDYLALIGIKHCDQKLENIVLVGRDLTPKWIDFGVVYDHTGRTGYREMGYVRRGDKFRYCQSLSAATPGFCRVSKVLGNPKYNHRDRPINKTLIEQFDQEVEKFDCGMDYYWYHDPLRDIDRYHTGKIEIPILVFLFCDWKTAWNLLFRPTTELEDAHILTLLERCNLSWLVHLSPDSNNIPDAAFRSVSSVFSLPRNDASFVLDSNITKSIQMSEMKFEFTTFFHEGFQNITKHVVDQKDSALCVPVCVANLLCSAILECVKTKRLPSYLHEDCFDIEKVKEAFSFTRIFHFITFLIYPRSLAGMNLNPNLDEIQKQYSQRIEGILESLKNGPYARMPMWNWMLGTIGKHYLDRHFLFDSKLIFHRVQLHRRFKFKRPLTVTAALKDENELIQHQMIIDRVEDTEYVLQNTQSDENNDVEIRIPLSREYYSETCTHERFPRKVISFFAMEPNCWYLYPYAYSIEIELDKEESSDEGLLLFQHTLRLLHNLAEEDDEEE